MGELKEKLMELKIKRLEEESDKHDKAIKILLSIIEVLAQPSKHEIK